MHGSRITRIQEATSLIWSTNETHDRRHAMQPAGRLCVVGRAGRRRARACSRSARARDGCSSEIDGLLLTGGGDVDPVLYGDERHPTVEDAEPGRDEFEIDLARRAMAGDLPLLAICRGAQVLNVAAGGTLVQDIPSLVDTALPHSIVEPEERRGA